MNKVLIGVFILIALLFIKKRNKYSTPVSHFNANKVSTSDNNKSLSSGDTLIFYAPWCGHCKTSMKDFKDAVSSSGGTVKLINSDEEPELVTKYKVKGFPTIIKTNGETYSGDRSSSSILDFANS
jgi:thiol-disulfide isomerase/thioredoxin